MSESTTGRRSHLRERDPRNMAAYLSPRPAAPAAPASSPVLAQIIQIGEGFQLPGSRSTSPLLGRPAGPAVTADARPGTNVEASPTAVSGIGSSFLSGKAPRGHGHHSHGERSTVGLYTQVCMILAGSGRAPEMHRVLRSEKTRPCLLLTCRPKPFALTAFALLLCFTAELVYCGRGC